MNLLFIISKAFEKSKDCTAEIVDPPDISG
jgi:hypothetical protein